MPSDRNDAQVPVFARVAESISPDRPHWLASTLHWWQPGLLVDCLIEEQGPGPDPGSWTQAEMCTVELAKLNETWSPNISSGAYTRSFGLQHLAEMRLMIGRGQPRATAKVLCALRIAEAWRHVHGRHPGTKNEKAAAAAEAYWRTCGDHAVGSLASLRYHFRIARKAAGLSHIAGVIGTWRRDLAQNKRRGRAPWPAFMDEFLSPAKA